MLTNQESLLTAHFILEVESLKVTTDQACVTTRPLVSLIFLINIKALGKYCLPDPKFMVDQLKPFVESFYKNYDVSKYTAYIGDLVKAWYVMAISIGVAVVTAIIYLLVLRCCAGVMIWMSIIGILGGLGGGGYWLYITKN